MSERLNLRVTPNPTELPVIGETKQVRSRRSRRLAERMDPKFVAACLEDGRRAYLNERRERGLGDPSVMSVSPDYFTKKYA